MKKKPKKDQFILDYFDKLRLSPSKTNKEFWSNIRVKYGTETFEILDSIVDEREKGLKEKPYLPDLYDFKNSSLKLSLDFSRYSADLYRRYFEWLMKLSETRPKHILDIGCDNGIVTCFYGYLFPDSEVIGIDLSENAVKCSIELSQKLGLNNVQFKVLDLEDAINHFPLNHFDWITDIRTIHEIIGGFPAPRSWSISEVTFDEYPMENQKAVNILSQFQKLLKDDGRFIAFERIANPTKLVWWVEMLSRVGLHPDWQLCERIRFHEIGHDQTMPLIIASKLLSKDNTIDQVHKFYIGNMGCTIKDDEVYKDPVAEYLFNSVKDKELLFGIQVNYSNGSGNLRIEVWKTDGKLLNYRYTNVGARKLQVRPINFIKEAKESLLEEQRNHTHAGNRTNYFEDINARDAFDS